MRVRTHTQKAHTYNEDGIINKSPLYIVFDGATPLFQKDVYQDSSAASQLVDFVIERIYSSYQKTKDLKNSIRELSIEAYHHFKIDTDEPSKIPSLGFAAVVDQGEYFDLYSLGDCAISIVRKNGTLERFIDTRVPKLDNEVKKELLNGKTREEVMPLLIRNRNALGTAYQAFIPSKNPNFIFITKRIKKSNVSKLLIYSDGYYSVRDTFKQIKSHQALIETDIHSIFNQINEAAYNDKDFKKYPRFKLIDDISVIELNMEL